MEDPANPVFAPSVRPSRRAQSERRRYGRRPVRVTPGRWIPNAWIEGEGLQRVPVLVRNVSLGGAQLETTVPLDKGTELFLCFQSPPGQLRLACVIANHHWMGDNVGERFYRLGVRFVEFDTSKIQLLFDLV